MSTLIIGFGHKARHGKDEAIQAILRETSGSNVRKYGFGDALKLEVAIAARLSGGMKTLMAALRNPFVADVLLGKDAPVLPPQIQYDPNAPMDDPLCPYGKQRTLLQWWGTELRRTQDPNYWVEYLMEKIAADKPNAALICDLRFPNEMAAIRAAGGYCVRVDRVGFKSDVPEHISEKALDDVPNYDWDYIIQAPDGRLDILQEEALNAFNFLSAAYRS